MLAMRRLTSIFAALLTLALTTAAWACPLCKDAIPSSDAQAPGGVPGTVGDGFSGPGSLEVVEWLCIFGDEPRIEWRFAGFHFVTGPEGWRSCAVAIPYWFILVVVLRLLYRKRISPLRDRGFPIK